MEFQATINACTFGNQKQVCVHFVESTRTQASSAVGFTTTTRRPRLSRRPRPRPTARPLSSQTHPVVATIVAEVSRTPTTSHTDTRMNDVMIAIVAVVVVFVVVINVAELHDCQTTTTMVGVDVVDPIMSFTRWSTVEQPRPRCDRWPSTKKTKRQNKTCKISTLKKTECWRRATQTKATAPSAVHQQTSHMPPPRLCLSMSEETQCRDDCVAHHARITITAVAMEITKLPV